MANRNYPDEDRKEAVRLIVDEGLSVSHVAREYSVGVGTVHRWVSDAVTAGHLPVQRLQPLTATDETPTTDPTSPPQDVTPIEQLALRMTALEEQMQQFLSSQEQRLAALAELLSPN